MLRGYLVSNSHKKKQNSNCYAYVLRDDLFNGNNSLFTPLGVDVTPEINMADKKLK